MFNSIRTFLLKAIQGNKASSEEKILHRVKVSNLPKKDTPQVKKFLNSHGIKKYKKAPQWTYAYIHADSEQAAKEAMANLNGIMFKKRTLATEYTPILEETFRQRYQSFSPPQVTRTAAATVGDTAESKSLADQLADQVTPLYKIPYQDQVIKKHKWGTRQLRQLRKKLVPLAELSQDRKTQLAWIYENVEDPPCQIVDPIASPTIQGYRTKCEFSIGKDPLGQPTVGFLQGLYRDGLTHVLKPSQSIHVPDISKDIAESMQHYIQASCWPVYDRITKTGVWRSLMVKAQLTGDVMVLVQMNSSDLTQHQLQQEKSNLVNHFHATLGTKVTTLMLQQWDGDSNGIKDEAPTEVLTGDGYVYEKLFNHRFRISSKAFFQVNTKVTELMLQTCAEWCTTAAVPGATAEKKKTTLLDLCCGGGSIGLTMAPWMDRVVGIDMVADAIKDAQFNAELNHITHAHYHVGKIEDKIHMVTKEHNEQVVAVLDPPRSGVHQSVIRAIREAPQIEKIVFISCDAKQAMQNFIGLCRPTSNKYQVVPFKPSRAITIDLFPHTDHSELMVEFVRI